MAVPVITNRGRLLALQALTTAAAAGTVKVMLMDIAHVFSSQLDLVASVSGDEISATNYARVTAAFGVAVTLADGRVYVPIDPTVFSAIGGAVNANVSGCYLFADSGNDATAPLIACVPFETSKATDGTDFRVTWPLETMTFRLPIL